MNAFVKNRMQIIMGHEDDRPNGENVNLIGYSFEKYGYREFSLQARYFDLFLSFKIERAVYKGFEGDTEFALNAIASRVLPLGGFDVVLDEEKHKHLLTKKGGKFRKAGIVEFERERIASLIKSKIEANYIYNLVHLEEHGVVKFNLMIEVDRADGGYPTRLMASLEYKPEERVLRVITLY